MPPPEKGCPFAPRCPFAQFPICAEQEPPLALTQVGDTVILAVFGRVPCGACRGPEPFPNEEPRQSMVDIAGVGIDEFVKRHFRIGEAPLQVKPLGSNSSIEPFLAAKVVRDELLSPLEGVEQGVIGPEVVEGKARPLYTYSDKAEAQKSAS